LATVFLLEDLEAAEVCLVDLPGDAFFDFEVVVFFAGAFIALEVVDFLAVPGAGSSGGAGRIKASNTGSSRTILTPASLTKGKRVKNPAADVDRRV
jgi:hypothetical protein